MIYIDDGGPAFPCRSINNDLPAGMSLRDWFAGQALIGMAKTFLRATTVIGDSTDLVTQHLCQTADECEEDPEYTVASACYCLADAMLLARKGMSP